MLLGLLYKSSTTGKETPIKSFVIINTGSCHTERPKTITVHTDSSAIVMWHFPHGKNILLEHMPGEEKRKNPKTTYLNSCLDPFL